MFSKCLPKGRCYSLIIKSGAVLSNLIKFRIRLLMQLKYYVQKSFYSYTTIIHSNSISF